jgi:hypothetical protein
LGLEVSYGKIVEGGVFAVNILLGFDEGEKLDAGVGGVEEAAILEHLGLKGFEMQRISGPVVG